MKLCRHIYKIYIIIYYYIYGINSIWYYLNTKYIYVYIIFHILYLCNYILHLYISRHNTEHAK